MIDEAPEFYDYASKLPDKANAEAVREARVESMRGGSSFTIEFFMGGKSYWWNGEEKTVRQLAKSLASKATEIIVREPRGPRRPVPPQ